MNIGNSPNKADREEELMQITNSEKPPITNHLLFIPNKHRIEKQQRAQCAIWLGSLKKALYLGKKSYRPIPIT